MKLTNRVAVCLINVIFAVLLFNLPRAFADEPKIIFHELMWAGSSASSNDEWIVLKNLTNQPIDLAGWRIVDLRDDENPKTKITITNGTIPKQGYFLIANYAASESVLSTEPDLIKKGLDINNTNLKLGLYNSDDPNNINPVDTVGDLNSDMSPPLGGFNGDIKTAMQRIEPVIGGDLPEAWQSVELAGNLDVGVTDLAWPRNSGRVLIQIDQTAKYLSRMNGDLSTKVLVGLEAIKSVSGKIGEQAIECRLESGFVKCFVPPNLSVGEYQVKLNLVDIIDLLDNFIVPLRIYEQLAPEISEIYPSPEAGESEWLELYNPHSDTLELRYWQIDDITSGGSSPFFFTDQVIEPNQYLVLPNSTTKLALNNSGDTVNLINPLGNLIQTVPYPAMESETAFAGFSGPFQITAQATPGQANIYKSNEIDENGPSRGLINISEISNFQDQIITTRGTVKSVEGDTIYLSQDGSEIKVYLQDSRKITRPKMTKGQEWEIIGLVNLYRGTLRLLPRTAEDFINLNPAPSVQAAAIIENPEPIRDINLSATGENKETVRTVKVKLASGGLKLAKITPPLQVYVSKPLSRPPFLWFYLIVIGFIFGLVNLWISLNQLPWKRILPAKPPP